MLNATTRYRVASATVQGVEKQEGAEALVNYYVNLRPIDKDGQFVSGGQDLNLTVLKPVSEPGVTAGTVYDVTIKEAAPGK